MLVCDVRYPQVILDHGMYRQLGHGFRSSYCRVWQGLIMQDKAILTQAANELGVGKYVDVSYKLASAQSLHRALLLLLGL